MQKKRLVILQVYFKSNKQQNLLVTWGRTIESVANQMRIFQQQTERLTRAIR